MRPRTELAALLGEHRGIHWGTYATCSCGFLLADMDSHPRGDQTADHERHLADAVLAWLDGQLDPLLTAVDIVLAEAGDDADEDPNLGEMAFCARELLAHLVLDGAAQDAQEGAVGPGSVPMGTGEGAAPNGAQIEDFEGER